MKLEYFSELATNFEAIVSVALEQDLVMFLQTAATPQKSPVELHVVDVNVHRLVEFYQSGAYSAVWLSKQHLPAGVGDWSILKRYPEQLIVVEGGRQLERVIELSKVREFSKNSDMKSAFQSLRRKIVSNCNRRGLFIGTTEYRNIWWDISLSEYELRESLVIDSMIYKEKRQEKNA